MRLDPADFVEGRVVFVVALDDPPWQGPYKCIQTFQEKEEGFIAFWAQRVDYDYSYFVDHMPDRIAFTNYWEARAYLLKGNMKCKK